MDSVMKGLMGAMSPRIFGLEPPQNTNYLYRSVYARALKIVEQVKVKHQIIQHNSKISNLYREQSTLKQKTTIIRNIIIVIMLACNADRLSLCSDCQSANILVICRD